MTPPTGPVFLALPLDVQMGRGRSRLGLDAAAIARLPRAPADRSLRQAAVVLADAQNPGILVGSRICEADAVAELVAVAERWARR